MLKKIASFAISKVEDVLAGIIRWEGMVAVLARDHKEVLSEKLRIALLIGILPNSLQERIMEHLDRLITYNDVHAKVVSLVQASPKYMAGDAMDCSGLDYNDDQYEDMDIDALSRDHCNRCGGVGHYARECPSPKGKGKGKGDRAKQTSHDKYANGKGNLFCSHCKRSGHNEATCWDLHPEQKRPKGKGKGKGRKIAALDEEEDGEVLGFLELSALDECHPCDPNGELCCSIFFFV